MEKKGQLFGSLKCRLYLCPMCQFASQDRLLVLKHKEGECPNRAVRSPSPGPPELNYTCLDCHYETTIPGMFNQHRLQVHGEGEDPLEAPQMVEESPIPEDDDEDDDVPLGERLAKALATKGPVTVQEASGRRKKNGGPPFGCSLCGYRALRPHILKKHELLHKRRARFQCHLCSYSVDKLNNLTVHQERHHRSPAKCVTKAAGTRLERPPSLAEIERIPLPETPVSIRSDGEMPGYSPSLSDFPTSPFSSQPGLGGGVPTVLKFPEGSEALDQSRMEGGKLKDEEIRCRKELDRLLQEIEAGWNALDKVQGKLAKTSKEHKSQADGVEALRKRVEELEQLERASLADKDRLDGLKADLYVKMKRVTCDRYKAELHLRHIQLDVLKAQHEMAVQRFVPETPELAGMKERERSAETVVSSILRELSELKAEEDELDRRLEEARNSHVGAGQLLELSRTELTSSETALSSLSEALDRRKERMGRRKADQEGRILEYIRVGERLAQIEYLTAGMDLLLSRKNLTDKLKI